MIKLNKQESNALAANTFIDLFAGIGGFHLALKSFGAKPIFASEWDKYSAKVYQDNFAIKPFGDITKIQANEIPKGDILCAGFPCQAFSISGKQKGFDDLRGTLFFDIIRIINHHKPKLVILENVKNLLKHDEGKTYKTIIKSLKNEGYNVASHILNASDYGLPQNRDRIYFVAFRNDLNIKNFMFPLPKHEQICLKDILEENPEAKIITRKDIKMKSKSIEEVDIFGNVLKYNKPIQIGIVNKGGQGERIYHILGHSITLSAYGGGVGSKTGLYLVGDTIRKLSTRECARLQGFPDTFKITTSQSQTYKQFGNAVPVNVLQYILKEVVKRWS